jgi:SAM-dependent methyltransferase
VDIEEYGNIYHLEDTYWWYRGLHELVISSIENYFLPFSENTILDVGCGTGGLLQQLRGKWPLSQGIDLSSEALKYCRMRQLPKICRGSAMCLPLKDDTIDSLISLDVIYHMMVMSDIDALKEYRRVLKPNGILVLNVPAFSFLAGTHDRVVHARERYTRSILTGRLLSAGFEILKITYRNFLTFPLVLGKRLLESWNSDQSGSDLKALPLWLNNFFFSLNQIDNRLLKHTNLPFGTSVFCIARNSQ